METIVWKTKPQAATTRVLFQRDDQGLQDGRLGWIGVEVTLRLDSSMGFHIQETRPLVLPRKSAVTKRIVQWTHAQLGHWTSAAVVTTTLHKRFWIPNMYEYVRGVIRHCFECLNNKAASQKFGALPKDIVQYETLEPFRHVAMDFAGPFKATENLGTDDLIMALLRFTAKRRCPTTIRTDKGGPFESD
jgi:hypothetical protein